MSAQVRELLAAGYDEEQILAYFERSYGEFVRLEPPLRGVNWLVWLAPAGRAAAPAAAWWPGRSGARRTRRGARPTPADRGRCPPRDALPDDPRAGAATSYACASWPTAGRAASRPRRGLMQRRPASTGARPLVRAGRGPRAGRSCSWRRLGARARLAAPPARRAPSLERRDLRGASATRCFVQLRELEDTAAKRTPEQLARERYALELEAAARPARAGPARAPAAGAGRDGVGQAPARRRGRGAAAAPRSRRLRGFLWGAGSMAALGRALRSSSRARHAARGGRLAHRQPAGGRRQRARRPADAEEQRCARPLARNPDDVDARARPGAALPGPRRT